MELAILLSVLLVSGLGAVCFMRERQARLLAQAETILVRGHLRDLRESLAASTEMVRMQGEQLASMEMAMRLGDWRRERDDLTPIMAERQMPPVRVSFQPEA
jgi:hypothetical protein